MMQRLFFRIETQQLRLIKLTIERAKMVHLDACIYVVYKGNHQRIFYVRYAHARELYSRNPPSVALFRNVLQMA